MHYVELVTSITQLIQKYYFDACRYANGSSTRISHYPFSVCKLIHTLKPYIKMRWMDIVGLHRHKHTWPLNAACIDATWIRNAIAQSFDTVDGYVASISRVTWGHLSYLAVLRRKQSSNISQKQFISCMTQELHHPKKALLLQNNLHLYLWH